MTDCEMFLHAGSLSPRCALLRTYFVEKARRDECGRMSCLIPLQCDLSNVSIDIGKEGRPALTK